MSRSFQDRIILDNTLVIVHLQLFDADEKPYFAYIALRPAELEKLMAAHRKGAFDPNTFGTLILAGTGTPSDEVKAYMEREYAFDHEKGITLT